MKSFKRAGLNSSTTTVAIALGSNLGDRDAYLDAAVRGLTHILTNLRESSRYETDPVDVPGECSPFLNSAVVGETTLSASELLSALMHIEADNGRERPHPNASRTLDLDLILYGERIIREPSLTVPHPRFRLRHFVLEPLAEVAPNLVDPVTRVTVAELLARLRQGSPAPAR